MDLRVLQDERFTCGSCTNCCRSWHVELIGDEPQAIAALQWPAGDPLAGAAPVFRQGGKAYLARKAGGACLFLNETNGLCRIHEQFGIDQKPVACRVYPFQIAPAFEGELTVAGRYDCPNVRRNEGAPYADELPALRQLARRLDLPTRGFTEATLCHLEPEQAQAVIDFASTLLGGFATGAERALFLAYLCDTLAMTSAEDLDRAALAQAYGPLKRLVGNAIAMPPARPGRLHRLAFRTLLGLFLRRDEDVMNRLAGRTSRTLALTGIVLGGGSFNKLGLSHPQGKLRRARLFARRPALQPHDPAVFALHWRMIRNKLQSFQFMGNGEDGRNFLEGLRLLALLYPLVLATARYSAVNRGADRIEASDVDYAVAAIEHSHGRLAILNKRATRSLERLLTEHRAFTRLVRSM
jgi:lysine-N-methylase